MIRLPLSYEAAGPCTLSGADWSQVVDFYPADPVRQIVRASLRAFVEQNRDLLRGRVLDYGCGRPGTCFKPEPYRDLVAGTYVGVDVSDPEPDGMFDAVMCTEVLPYILDPAKKLRALGEYLRPGGAILVTYTAAWPEAEASSLWRFTQSGMERMFRRAGFVSSQHVLLSELVIGNFRLPLGHGSIAYTRKD